jgi:hypothetical protein
MSEIEFEVERDESIELGLTRDELAQAVLFTTDWTVETVLSQLSKGNIGLNPAFQRRDAWRIEKKSRFIESLLLGLPIPQIVLAEDKANKGRYLVLDGKQRLLTLLQFSGQALESEWNRFKLKDLSYLPSLEGHSIESLNSDPQFAEDSRAFLNYPIRSSIIRHWPNSRYLETVFVRLNEGSLRLSPQELRQAMSTGPFATYLDNFVSDSIPMRMLLKNNGPDFRMRDTELMLRLLAFAMFPTEYTGDMKAFLDSTMDRLNAEWSQLGREAELILSEINEAIRFGHDVLPDSFARKYDLKQKGYSNYLNRAVAEIQIYYFRNPKVRAWISANPGEFESIFAKLATENQLFQQSLEVTTKSLTSVGARFGLLGEVLKDSIDEEIRPLHLESNRLKV